jgi:mono/diheme cytochrome c family protein
MKSLVIRIASTAVVGVLAGLIPIMGGAQSSKVQKVWDEEALAEWATPVVGLNVRPGHFTEKEYYSAPVDTLRTYPMYYPGREPEGYWEMLQKVGPLPLIEADKLKTDMDWIEAGQRVFEELDVPNMRKWDPKLIEELRSAEVHQQMKTPMAPDGTLFAVRWIPTTKGLAVGLTNCGGCHIRYLENGRQVNGAPANVRGPNQIGKIGFLAASVLPLEGDTPGMAYYRNYGVPWIKDDIHEQLKKMERPELGRLFASAIRYGTFPRWGGSVYYTTKIPDLIGFKDRRWIDHTATHQHRDLGDLMRYAALVSYAEAYEFGPHKILADPQRRIDWRASDEALYALALYIYSLKPPPNPHPFDESARAGEKIFKREGCVGCHTPPLYTNNKLTLADGFTPPKDKPSYLEVMELSVGTDPGLALKTRKGTGYYKVPSLKGLWYRGHYLHDGSVASLEEMFDPDRVKDTHIPGGWKLPDTKTRAIKGHPFGLALEPQERTRLIAFLKTI